MKKVVLTLIIGIACFMGWMLYHTLNAPIPHEASVDPGDPTQRALSGSKAESTVAIRAPAANAPRPNPRVAATSAGDWGSAPSAEHAQALVAKITETIFGKTSFTHADAEALKQQFADLKAQGALAVPAVRAFLAKNQDVSFLTIPELDSTLRAASLRLAMMDVLQSASGPEVVSAAADTLKSTGDPTEIATLASILEKNEPGEHRLDAVKAAADSLALANSGQLNGQRMGPAFEVLETYGDTNVIPLLRDQVKGNWSQNAAIALAELPDGAGIPALVAALQDPNAGASAEATLRPLAQVAVRYPQAFDALLDQARQGKIPDNEWQVVASALAASDYVSNGAILPESHSPGTELSSMLPQRLQLIDRLSSADGVTVAGRQALQQQRGQLMARMASHP
jgi:hypothetical protein